MKKTFRIVLAINVVVFGFLCGVGVVSCYGILAGYRVDYNNGSLDLATYDSYKTIYMSLIGLCVLLLGASLIISALSIKHIDDKKVPIWPAILMIIFGLLPSGILYLVGKGKMEEETNSFEKFNNGVDKIMK